MYYFYNAFQSGNKMGLFIKLIPLIVLVVLVQLVDDAEGQRRRRLKSQNLQSQRQSQGQFQGQSQSQSSSRVNARQVNQVRQLSQPGRNGMRGKSRSLGGGGKSRIDGVVYRVRATDQHGLKALVTLQIDDKIDMWTPLRVGSFVTVLVLAAKAKETEVYFTENNLEFLVSTPSLQNLYDVHRENRKRRQKDQSTKDITWDQYYSYEEIYAWLSKLQKDFPTLVSVQVIGQTFEDKDINVVRICKNGCGRKPAIFIDGGAHAREWLSISTSTYIINELVTHAGKYSSILDHLDIYMVPILNVDGYEYSWRIPWWRKNRRYNGGRCHGVDLNRNFGYKWGRAGSSNNPCSIVYKGPKAFSEKETQAIRNFVLGQKKKGVRWECYVSLHGFGQYILTPWGWTSRKPKDYTELKRLGDKMADVIESVHRKTFKVGSSTALLGAGAGGSDDWMKAGAGIPYSYTFEVGPSVDDLRPGSAFVVPGEEILQICAEVFTGVQVLLNSFADKAVLSPSSKSVQKGFRVDKAVASAVGEVLGLGGGANGGGVTDVFGDFHDI